MSERRILALNMIVFGMIALSNGSGAVGSGDHPILSGVITVLALIAAVGSGVYYVRARRGDRDA